MDLTISPAKIRELANNTAGEPPYGDGKFLQLYVTSWMVHQLAGRTSDPKQTGIVLRRDGWTIDTWVDEQPGSVGMTLSDLHRRLGDNPLTEERAQELASTPDEGGNRFTYLVKDEHGSINPPAEDADPVIVFNMIDGSLLGEWSLRSGWEGAFWFERSRATRVTSLTDACLAEIDLWVTEGGRYLLCTNEDPEHGVDDDWTLLTPPQAAEAAYALPDIDLEAVAQFPVILGAVFARTLISAVSTPKPRLNRDRIQAAQNADALAHLLANTVQPALFAISARNVIASASAKI